MIWLYVSVALLIGYLTLLAIGRGRAFEPPPLVAHRGLHDNGGALIENSLAAFEAAVARGYAIELDVQLTTDDKLAVFHDDTLLRLCAREGDVQSLPMAQLKECRLLSTQQRIPELCEVLNLVRGQVPLVIELKRCPRMALLVRLTLDALAGYEGPLVIESFDPFALVHLRRMAPAVIRGQLIPRGGGWLLFLAPLTRPDFVAYELGMDRSATLFVLRHMTRVRLCAWTVRTMQQHRALSGRCDMRIFEGFEP